MSERLKNTIEDDDTHTLPEDPAEAASLLQQLWRDREGNRPKGKSLDEMTEEEREDFRKEMEFKNKTEPDFQWLADIFFSEMGWTQSSIDTNYGKVFWFKFGDESRPEEVPDAFVYYPSNHDYENGVILVGKRGGWSKQPIREFQSDHWKQFNDY